MKFIKTKITTDSIPQFMGLNTEYNIQTENMLSKML